MIVVENKNFDLHQICQSGQCFRMNRIGETDLFEVIAYGKYLKISQNDSMITFYCSEEEYKSVWRNYFDIDTDYEKIITKTDANDTYLQQAVSYGSGIRILNQDLWEMIITFIVSQQNNVKRIRKCINTLCEQYGEKMYTDEGSLYYDFPTPLALSEVSEEELKKCNLGYRSKYIHRTSTMIANDENILRRIKEADYQTAKQQLLELYGIGNKVADCICLFALHFHQAFPIDTHIKKVLEENYSDGFPFERYKDCCGVLQQYMFYYDLNSSK